MTAYCTVPHALQTYLGLAVSAIPHATHPLPAQMCSTRTPARTPTHARGSDRAVEAAPMVVQASDPRWPFRLSLVFVQ